MCVFVDVYVCYASVCVGEEGRKGKKKEKE